MVEVLINFKVYDNTGIPAPYIPLTVSTPAVFRHQNASTDANGNAALMVTKSALAIVSVNMDPPAGYGQVLPINFNPYVNKDVTINLTWPITPSNIPNPGTNPGGADGSSADTSGGDGTDGGTGGTSDTNLLIYVGVGVAIFIIIMAVIMWGR